jgi:hypothetical protein
MVRSFADVLKNGLNKQKKNWFFPVVQTIGKKYVIKVTFSGNKCNSRMPTGEGENRFRN